MKINEIDKQKVTDWRWRLANWYKIIDKQGQLINLRPNGIQRAINQSDSRRKMILKYRQGGVTTNEVLKQLDFVAFNRNKTACIMADEQKNMERIFSKVRLAHRHMPTKVRPRLGKGGGSKYEMIFPDLNSRIYCTIEGRGDTINHLHISEAAFAQSSRIRSTIEAVPPDGVITFESTANGMGGDFYKRWVTPSNILDKLFYPWFIHEEYTVDDIHVGELTNEEKEFCIKAKANFGIDITAGQIAFRRSKQEDQGIDFLQEYPEDAVTCFLASGGAAMDLELINDLLTKSSDPLSDTGILEIYEEFNSSKRYAAGADTAEGRGGDYSVITIFDVATRKEVAQLRSNKMKPRAFAIECYNLCERYHKPGREWPLLAVERNNHGHAVLLELEEHLGYVNLYYYKEDVAGWKTDSVTRPIMVDTFIDSVENGTTQLNSRHTMGECLTLIDNKGKIEAEDGENDDCIIAASIGIQMCIVEAGNVSVYDNLESSIMI